MMVRVLIKALVIFASLTPIDTLKAAEPEINPQELRRAHQRTRSEMPPPSELIVKTSQKYHNQIDMPNSQHLISKQGLEQSRKSLDGEDKIEGQTAVDVGSPGESIQNLIDAEIQGTDANLDHIETGETPGNSNQNTDPQTQEKPLENSEPVKNEAEKKSDHKCCVIL